MQQMSRRIGRGKQLCCCWRLGVEKSDLVGCNDDRGRTGTAQAQPELRQPQPSLPEQRLSLEQQELNSR
ncbi:hypothetical protein CDV36_005075 [Fusarium kuroshium]|uniref:Uncharacterized protein n=1 Tax=Fusarium kuroshium TaxID=2010991 RepID=A0A3M2SCG5_9HYPO|nr:hypothetical protein CDV36_005075 [Fusarium kuroshium]